MSIDAPLISAAALRALSDRWWLFLLRGIAAVAFGLLSFLWPGVTLLTLVLFFGIYALVDGVLSLVSATASRSSPTPRWWLVIYGLLGVAAGIATFVWPGMTALLLLIFIASWAIAIGFFLIYGGIRLRKEIEGEWLLILTGVISILAGILMFVVPGASALALVWLVASYAILFGILTIGFAFRLRRLRV
jgi:uncharacterized membrane protein HdeD (DUF308 family)